MLNLAQFVQSQQNRIESMSWWPEYQQIISSGAGGDDGLRAAANLDEQGYWANKYPDWVSGGGHDLIGGALAQSQDKNSNVFGFNIPSTRAATIAGVSEIAGLATMGAGAAGAFGAGAGAAEGGAAGAGIDASTGAYAGETAASGSAGAGAYGGGVSAGGSNMLVADAAGVPGGTMTDATAVDAPLADETGAFDMYGSNAGAPGGQPGSVFDYSSPSTNYLQTAQDWAKQLGITPAAALQMLIKGVGRAAPAALGVVGASQQQKALEEMAQKYLEFGAPSRARYEASFAPGFTMANDPGYKDALDATTKATLHRLSVNGNPAGSPNAWDQTLTDVNTKLALPALQNFRSTNANAGGIATLQTAAPGADASAINAGRGIFDAIGGGINDIFNPKPSLAQTLADYKRLLGTAA
jgi:hypothetical protein